MSGTTVTRDDGTFEVHGIGAGDYDMVSRLEGARTAKPVNVKLELVNNAPLDAEITKLAIELSRSE